MNVAPLAGGFFQVADHDVYKETADGGQTWQDVPNNLPGLDLHAFVADPADSSHAWAFAVGFGLFETVDKGRTWELRQPGGWGALTAFVEGGRTILIGLGPMGLGRSHDGGRSWTPLGQPTGQLASLAASADGSVLYAGTTQGASMSTDGGRTWTATTLDTVGVTLAVHPSDPNVLAVVDDALLSIQLTVAQPGPAHEERPSEGQPRPNEGGQLWWSIPSCEAIDGTGQPRRSLAAA